MNVVTTEDYEDIWEGSFIHDVTLEDGFYTGMWASRMGTYKISVPQEICEIKE